MSGAELEVRSGLWRFVKKHWRWAALALGVAALVVLIRDVGPAQVWAAIVVAFAVLPLVIACDIAFFTSEVAAHRLLLGADAARVPLGEYIRVSLMTYAFMVLAPVGRAGAEVARTASLARYVGAGRASAAAAHTQVASLLANGLVSIPCAVAVAAAVGPAHVLTWLVVGNGALTALVACAALLVARSSRLGRWLGAKVPRLQRVGEDLDAALAEGSGRLARATLLCFAGRVAQTLQYAAILFGLVGATSLGAALVAQAIHLVGAGLGDFVPNQVGILEGAYRVFADAIHLENTPAHAVSIALVARLSQAALVSVCLAALALWRAPALEPSPQDVAR